MYSKLHDKIPNMEKFFERIGYKGKPSLTKEFLNEILNCCITSIPYENLTAWLGFAVNDLGINTVYEKIVVKKRGGICTETNALLQTVLEEVGFKCVAISGKIIIDQNGYNPINHRAIMVYLDGKKYLMDAAQGCPTAREIMVIDENTPTKVENEFECFTLTHQQDEKYLLSRYSYGKYSNSILFDIHPFDYEDFLAFSFFFMSRNQQYETRWSNNLLISVATPRGYLRLINYELTTMEDGIKSEYTIQTREELFMVIKEKFNIEVL